MSTNARRRTTALVAAAALASGLVTLTTSAHPAEAVETVIYVSGDFWDLPSTTLDDGDEIIEYRPGTGDDYIWHKFDHTSSSVSFEPVQLADINGTYQPFAGDFDGDGFDEVVWYAPGTANDYMWDIDHTAVNSIDSILLSPINNNYLTAVGDFTGDGTEDVFWYTPNTNQTDEQFWDFAPDTLTPIGSTSPYGVNSADWLPYGGDFSGDGADDLVWYKTTTGAVYRWEFDVASTLTRASNTQLGTVNANITEAVTLDRRLDGRTDIMWYTAGTTVDPYWDYDAAGNRTIINQTNNSNYDLLAGNFFQNGNPSSINDNDNSGDDVFLRGGSSYFHNYYVDDAGTVQLQVLGAGGSSLALSAAIDEAAKTNAANGNPDAPIRVTVGPDKTTIRSAGRTTTVTD